MATRLLQLPATCPADQNEREACGQCLRERLLVTPGVRDVAMDCKAGEETATVTLDYDPTLITLSELDGEVRRAGACLLNNRAQVVLGIEGMVSPRSEAMIESSLAKLPGVVASASFASRSLRVEFDRNRCALPEIVRRLDEIGMHLRAGGPVKSAKPQAAGSQNWADFAKEYRKLLFAIVAGILLLGAVILRATHVAPSARYLLVAAAGILAGWGTAKATFHILREFHFNIDVLMFAAAIGAAAIGHYEEGAFLLVLFALGGAGEEIAMDRARRAIEALAKLAPETATVRDPQGKERLVNVQQLTIGDQIVIRPFERVPADATVTSGESSIDQSPITGESIPVEKSAGAQIFAGTINGDGMLIAGVSKLASESMLARIVKMVEEAQTTKSPTQVFTARVEKWYVPFVLIATATLIFTPTLAFGGEWMKWFYRSMAFLTAASPCALAIGTPAAVLSGIARAARIGVLVKGGVHLENLGRITAIALDKTGTLTVGRPEVTEIIATGDSISSDELLALAAAVEGESSHPLASAIVAEARAKNLNVGTPTHSSQIPGFGMKALLDGKSILAGRAQMFDKSADAKFNEAVAKMSSLGRTIVAIGIDDHPVGLIALADRPRDNARASLDRLRKLGVTRTIMLTGDRQSVAEQVAQQVGIDEFHADLLPEGKVKLLTELQSRYGPIAMIGDGVNDAPALATATVGIAMGGAGTDVAIETADVALMADDLGKLPDAIGLSRFSRMIIRENITLALSVICVLAPLAALGFTDLWFAVLFHEGSTVVVVLNSLRLLIYKPRKQKPG